jgi:S1-C subfamily serine protease
MRMDAKTLVVPLATFIPGVAHPADTFTGSGVVVGTRGEILTNAHVVESCEKITVQLSSRDSRAAVLVARDQRNDLAVVRIDIRCERNQFRRVCAVAVSIAPQR